MTIYKLEVTIDGFGGRLPNRYFTDYDKAKNHLSNTSGFWYMDNGEWNVEGMKRCEVSEENNSFYLIGIQFPKEEWDEWCIRYCRASITPIELNFAVLNNELYALKYCRGYNHWFAAGFDNHYESFSDYEINNPPSVLGYYGSRKKAKKSAARNKMWKQIGRAWVRPEFDIRCSSLGSGQDYLSIEKIILEV